MRDSAKLTADWIAVQRAGTFVGNRQEALVRRMFVAVRREMRADASPAKTAKRVEQLILEASVAAYGLLNVDMARISILVTQNAGKQIEAIGIDAKPSKPSKAKLKKWMEATPMASSFHTIKDVHDSGYLRTARMAKNAIILAAGDKAIARASMKGIESQMLNYATSTSTSSANQVANSSKQDAFKSVDRWADRVMWQSTLDHRTCFIAGTEIDTPDGAVPIEQVKIGTVVCGTGDTEVIDVLSHAKAEVIKLSFDTGEVICTPSHRFLTMRGWVEASELRPSDEFTESA